MYWYINESKRVKLKSFYYVVAYQEGCEPDDFLNLKKIANKMLEDGCGNQGQRKRKILEEDADTFFQGEGGNYFEVCDDEKVISKLHKGDFVAIYSDYSFRFEHIAKISKIEKGRYIY